MTFVPFGGSFPTDPPTVPVPGSPPLQRVGADGSVHTYWCVWGNWTIAQGPVRTIAAYTWDQVIAYQAGAPDIAIAEAYSCVWRLAAPRPAAKKTWASLSERTKQGYRGVMRRMGLKTEEQFAHYYETTPYLGDLRRHPRPRPPISRTGITWAGGRPGDRTPIYLIMWRKH